MSRTFSVRFHQFHSWDFHTVVFLSISLCWFLCCQSCFLSRYIVFLFFFFYVVFESSYWYISALSMQASLLLLHSFFNTYNLFHLSGERAYVPSLVFLFSGAFVKVLPSSISRMDLTWGTAQLFTPLWDSCYRVWFRDFSFVWDTLFFKAFLSSPLVWWYPLVIFPSTCMFPLLRLFWFFLDLAVLFFLLHVFFLLLIISIGHFSMPNSIPVYWLYSYCLY